MSIYQAINLSALPQPLAVQVWTMSAIVQARLTDFTARMLAAGIAYDTAGLESEPAVKLQETGAYREGLIYQRINEAVLATSLAYAEKDDLDIVAATMNTARAAGEQDASLRARAQQAWEALAQGGTYGGYWYRAISAAPVDLADVAVYGPEVSGVAPGEVRIILLGAGASGVPSAGSVAAVNAVFGNRANRKVNDVVTIHNATPLLYDVTATLVLEDGADAASVIASQTAALNAYAASRRKIGELVTTTMIAGVLGGSNPGLVYDVTLTSPSANVGGDPFSAPVLRNVVITSTPRTAPP